MSREAMKLALMALEKLDRVMKRSPDTDKAITALKQALEQPEPEPVAEVRCDDGGNLTAKFHVRDLPLFAPLYTAPPKREPPCKTGSQCTTECMECAEPEPVAVVSGYYGGKCVVLPTDPARTFNSGTAFYTRPPKREWQWLTDEEKNVMTWGNDIYHILELAEAKLKEKNA